MNENILSAIFDNAAVLMVVLDREGRIVRFNAACEHATGFRESELRGEHIWTRLVPATEAGQVVTVFHDLLESQGDSRYTNHWLTKTNETRLIEWCNSTVREHGVVQYVIAVGVDVTDSEQERVINAKKSAALEASLNAVALAELDGTLSYINPAFRRLWGYDCHEELLGRHVLTFWMQPDEVAPVVDILLKQGQWLGELEARRKDGSSFIAQLSAKLVRDAAGNPLCMMSSFNDISALRAAEAAASDNQQRFEALFNAASDGIVVADIDTATFVSANPRWQAMLGYGAEEITRLGVRDIHPPEYQAENELRFGQLARGEIDVVECIPVLRKDGSLFYADISAAPITVGDKCYLAGLFRDVTARVQAEQALRASEEKYRLLLDNQNELIVKFTPDFRLTFVNPVYCRTFDKSEAELLQRSFIPLIAPEDRARILASLDTLRQPPHTCYHEERAMTVSGPRWLAWSDRAILDAQGEIVEIVAVGRDITAQKNAEDELRRKEGQLEEAQRLAHVGSWELDIPSGELHWSAEIYNIFELPQEERVASYAAFLDTIHPDDRNMVNQAYQRSVAEHVPYAVEHRLLLADGRIKYVQELGYTSYADTGAPLRSVGTVQDVTERRLNEQKLRQWAAAFENTIEGVIITDAKATIIDVNPAFETISGFSRAEVIGQKPNIRRSELQSEDFYANMWRTLQATGSWKGEIWNRRKSGEVLPEWLTITTLYDGSGAVSNYVGVFTDISAIKESEQRLEYLANHDPLTDLPNRALLSDRLEQALLRARRNGSKVALLFLDLDRFKNVNDTLGHPIGDRMLIEVAARLQAVLRESDTIGRLGGDEFLVILEAFDSNQELNAVAEKIIEAMTRPFVIDGHVLYIGVSIGISIGPENGAVAALLIQNADTAMYKAKEAGRNTFHYYSTEFTTLAKRNLEIEVELRSALARQELELYYQPKIDLHSGRVLGAEALVRWNSPARGLVPPDDFIPLAEDNGLIIPIGNWVLQQACRTLATWQQNGLAIAHVAVNVSSLQIHRGDLLEVVTAALAAAELEPAALELEITESVLIQSPEKAGTVLTRLRDKGIHLALDDFGTGYSSLSNLKDYPFTTIKIDRTFVQDIAADSNDEAIIRAVIAMGHNLRLAVVAEGVESRAQEEFLARHGCHIAQGYLYSKPLAQQQFEQFLRQQMLMQPADSA